MALGSPLPSLARPAPTAAAGQPQPEPAAGAQQNKTTKGGISAVTGGGAGPSRLEPIVTELRLTDLYPDTPATISGWEEALLCAVGFPFVCAPVTWALGNAAVLFALGCYRAHKALWGLYFVYWALLYLGLVPEVCGMDG